MTAPDPALVRAVAEVIGPELAGAELCHKGHRPAGATVAEAAIRAIGAALAKECEELGNDLPKSFSMGRYIGAVNDCAARIRALTGAE